MKIASFSAALLLGLVSADDAEMTGRQLQATTSAHYVECGKVGRCRSETGYLAPNNEVHEIRCCSNDPPTEFSGRWDVRSPRTALTSGFTCPWTESPQWDNVNCPAGTYEEAEDICAQVPGARLCTVEEALNDCLRGTGCGFDNDLIWTSTTAPPPPTGTCLFGVVCMILMLLLLICNIYLYILVLYIIYYAILTNTLPQPHPLAITSTVYIFYIHRQVPQRRPPVTMTMSTSSSSTRTRSAPTRPRASRRMEN